MKPNLVFLSILLCATLMGCATTQLSARGKEVKFLKNIPSDATAGKYEELSTLKCSRGMNFREPGDNIIECRNELRNKAADLGADFVVVEDTFGAGCPNCVTLIGAAYRYKQP